MFIAVIGCGHGKLSSIYEEIEMISNERRISVDLVLICGDFQATRNSIDLSKMACPPKYRHMEDFHLFYDGTRVAPIPTLFVGGNHEASNHLWELYFGGWVCPNVYFMGFSGVVWFGGLRIGGISGIYKPFDFKKRYHERLPFSESDIRSIYHYREFEIDKLASIKERLDVFISHDWPSNIYNHGNVAELLKRKPFFKQDIETGKLGSPPLLFLLRQLHPSYWFSGHLHVKFAAVYDHREICSASLNKLQRDLLVKQRNENDYMFRDVVAKTSVDADRNTTRFLGLDKCVPKRRFVQILEMEEQMSGRPKEFFYDPEWLCILKATNKNLGETIWSCGGDSISTDHVQSVPKTLEIPRNFRMTSVPFSKENDWDGLEDLQNPQTLEFCSMLGMECYVFSSHGSVKTSHSETHIQ